MRGAVSTVFGIVNPRLGLDRTIKLSLVLLVFGHWLLRILRWF
jgi:hypothetical protein